MKNEENNTLNNQIQQTRKYTSLDYYLSEDRVYVSDMAYAHVHAHYELYFLLSGTQRYFIKNRYYDMQEGDVILVPANTTHQIIQHDKKKQLVFHFTDFFLAKFLNKRAIALLEPLFKQKIFHPTRENVYNLHKLFLSIAQAQKNNDETQIFLDLMRIFTILSDCPIATATEEAGKRSLIDAVIHYIHEHYDTIKGLDDVASALFVSKYYVCHLFTKYMGTSFNNYLTDLRLKKAEQFVAYSKRSIQEIATLCGFSSSTYFCKVFKQKHKMSPIEYRKKVTQ